MEMFVAKKTKINTAFTLRYNAREDDTGDTVMDLDISFDNATDDVLIERINTWLAAIGKDISCSVVTKVGAGV